MVSAKWVIARNIDKMKALNGDNNVVVGSEELILASKDEVLLGLGSGKEVYAHDFSTGPSSRDNRDEIEPISNPKKALEFAMPNSNADDNCNMNCVAHVPDIILENISLEMHESLSLVKKVKRSQ